MTPRVRGKGPPKVGELPLLDAPTLFAAARLANPAMKMLHQSLRRQTEKAASPRPIQIRMWVGMIVLRHSSTVFSFKGTP
jgi:hypothetical protein